MATPNYDIDYNDKRFTEVEADKNEALTQSDTTYNDMISNSDKYFKSQINASKDYANTQKQNQQAQTDFAIEQIEQQKAQAKQDYTKEQSGAYVDWQKQSAQYGANAEQMAAQGLQGTGYSESAQVSMYNTYQNRVVAAREAYTRAVLNYDNAIKDARLQNNSALAEIAYQALQKQLELSLQGFQYKNQLVLEKANKRTELEQIYHSRYQDVLKQINTENALAEEVRQYNETLAAQKAQHEAEMEYKNKVFEWQKEQAEKASSGGGTINKNNGSGIKTSSYSGKTTKKETATISNAITGQKTPQSDTSDAEAYINALISSGATKDKVMREINLAVKYKELTAEQAKKLAALYAPRGVQY